MDNIDNQSDSTIRDSHSDAELRRQAQGRRRDIANLSLGNMVDASPKAMHRMFHELRVHQIELELQNEELRRVQGELESSRARYFDLYDLAPVGYCTVDENGLVMEANLNVATLLGVSRKVLIKQPISRYIFKWDQDAYYLCRKQLLATGQAQTCELRLIKSDGSLCWLQVALSAVQGVDGACMERMVLSDIGAGKQLELKLSSAIALAEKANAEKSNFLSGFSHELRTPLNAILGFAQLLESATPPPTPSEKHNIDRILQAGWYLLKLIEEILDLAQIEAGKLSLFLEPVSLTDVMNECKTMIEEQAQQRRIRIFFPAFTTTYIVTADQTSVKQVFINLLSNAIKYNKMAGTLVVSFTISSSKRIRVSIEDGGEGLSPEQVEKLFQPFNRLGQEGGTAQGTGLGLAMTKRLVELMGGEIGVQSTPGKGSVFWVELNLIAGGPHYESQ